MKTLFIEARKKVEFNPENKLGKLPKNIGLLTTVQYVHLLPKVKAHLLKKGKKVFMGQGKLTKHNGQILGCDVSSAEKISGKIDAYLIIGSDSFHYSPVLMLGKPVFTFSPEINLLKRIDKKELDKVKIKKKSALMKFYKADKIGIIVSTKLGQCQLKSAIKLKNDLEKKNKKAFIFICDNIDLKELENFNCESWVSSACPALLMEPEILNMQDIRL